MNLFDLLSMLRELELPNGIHIIKSDGGSLIAPEFDLNGCEFRLRRLIEVGDETHARWVRVEVRSTTPSEVVERNIQSALAWIQASDEPGHLVFS